MEFTEDLQRERSFRIILTVVALMSFATIMKNFPTAEPAEIPEDQRVVLDEMQGTHDGHSGETESR